MRHQAIFLFALLALASCSVFEKNEATISGTVSNYDNDFALLTSKGITDTIWLNNDGSFTQTVTISEPTYYTLRTARLRNTLYLAPGGSIEVAIDIKKPEENPYISGSLANQNQILAKVNKAVNGATQDFRAFFTLSKEAFAAKTDSIVANAKSIISSCNDKTFVGIEQSRVDYLAAMWQYNYPEYNARISGNEFTRNESDYQFMNDIDFSNTKHFSLNEYTALVENHINNIYYTEIAKDEHKGKSVFEQTLILFDMIDSLVTDPTMQDYYKHNSTSEAVKWSSLEIAKNVAEHFVKTSKSDTYRTIIENALAKRMLLAPGQPAPSFTLTDIEGNEHSLSDFKGQLVYIDFWASWCGPCRREIPHLKKVKEAYKGKPIAFLAISLDDDKSAWERMVEKEELKGYQLHAEKAWQSDVAKQYQIYGVPTFVLIDGEGKIIEYPATRPSDPETILIFDKHLK